MCKSVAFLLGAGCEGKGQLELPSGAGFKRDTIVARNVSELIYAINSATKPQIKNGPIITANSTSILYQTIREYGVNVFSLKNRDMTTVTKYMDLKTNDTVFKQSEKDKRKNRFADIYRKQFYMPIISERITTDKLGVSATKFLEIACFYSFVDSLFNCLRKPELYPNEVNRVIKLYFAAYSSVMLRLFNDSEMRMYEDIINAKGAIDHSIAQKRQMIEELVNSAQKRIIAEKYEKTDIYYNMIRTFINERETSDAKIGIVTTNYTKFAQEFTGISNENIAYIHGKLNLFESLKSKRISKLTDFSADDFVFPYILIQSGIKPIVNGYQIHEFEKAVRMIDESEELFILGYGVNSDDEHITNLLRTRLQDGKKITCFLHNNTVENQKNVERELQISGKVRFENSTDFGKVLDSLK